MNYQVAKRKDGTPAQKGDRVLVVLDNGQKHFGDLISVERPMRFRHLKFANLQTYRVRCCDGMTRPVHARHIKTAFLRKHQRKELNYGT